MARTESSMIDYQQMSVFSKEEEVTDSRLGNNVKYIVVYRCHASDILRFMVLG